MPYSGNDFDELLKLKLHELHPGRVFDIGIGAGKIGQIVRSCLPEAYITGIELEPSYEIRFAENWRAYNRICSGDVLTWSTVNSAERFDMIIAGDVIEHMWSHEVTSLADFWLSRCKWFVAIWPTGYPQDAYEGVLSEVHRCSPVLACFLRFDIRCYEKRERGVGVPGQKHFLVLRGGL